MKNKIKEKIEIEENIISSPLDGVLISAFDRYAKAVISDRAIPDVRDGLKPVQRRIIYDMYKNGQVFSKPTVKCATIVGHVMGHLHPHGDSSIYDALVHMSQDWKMSVPLIAFQGNNGGIDDDPPAANRYTEAKLAKISDYMCEDLDKKTVDMTLTFDDKSLEPIVLPSKFPNLLVNGTSGIAVGSTTFIPPHNLNETINAIIYRLEHKRSTLEDIMNLIPCPDFPTGGILDDKEAIKNLYGTGKGSFSLYSRCEVDEEKKEIHIKEIPFGVVKKELVSQLCKRKENDKLDNIAEIVDESAEDYIDICIKIKENASCDDILNYLQSKGALRTTISCNFLALDNGHPKTMSLMEIIDSYISHQRVVLTKSLNFDLVTYKNRLEIVEGLIKAYPIIDELIKKIRKCSGKEDVKKMIINDYHFTERQAEAIAMLPLYRLSNTDIMALRKENDEINEAISHISEVLADGNKLDKEIINTLKEINKSFVFSRKTTLLEQKYNFAAVSTTKLIAKEECYVMITRDGYAKRSSVKSFQASYEANKKDNPLGLPKLKPGDMIVVNNKCSTHDNLLLFTDLGNYCFIPVHLLSDMKWKDEGKHLNNLISLQNNEKIIKAFFISDFSIKANVVILTKLNKIKRVTLASFIQEKITRKPLRACKLSDKDDKVVSVTVTSGNSDLIVVDNKGRASRFNENEIELVSPSAIGVKAISSSIDQGDLIEVISINSVENPYLFVLSNRRACRIISASKVEKTERLGAKTNLIRIFKSNPMIIVAVLPVEKARNQDTYLSVLTKDKMATVNIRNIDPIDVNCDMRENITSLGNQEIIGVNQFASVVDENFKVEEPAVIKTVKVKVKPTVKEGQISLFDLFEKSKNS